MGAGLTARSLAAGSCLMQYKIAAAKMIADLEVQVNELLERGFELHGSPFVSARGFFCQALIERTPPMRPPPRVLEDVE